MQKNKVDDFIANPKKALLILALPIAIGMIVQAMYNIVDTAFVGRLGAESIAALTFSFPIFFIFIAINSGIAVGVGSLISRHLGAKKKKEAENVTLHGVYLSIILALFVFITGTIFQRQIFELFGAEGNVLALGMDYMSIILFGTLFIFPMFLISTIFSSQGDTKTPMKLQIYGLILNIILDPIFIYSLNLGVKGAAIATVIAFGFSLVLAVYFINKKSYLEIKRDSFKFDFSIIKNIFSVGFPATLMILLISIYVIFINRFMSHFGVEYVAAFGIASRLESIAIIPIISISMAMVTLAGMFYGANKLHLLKETSYYGIKATIMLTSAIGVVFFIFPELLLRIFTPDRTLIEIGSQYTRINVITFPLMGISMVISRILQGIGLGLPGFIINFVRVIIVAVPLSYLFVYILGYGFISIAIAMVIGGFVSCIIALWWLAFELRKIHAV